MCAVGPPAFAALWPAIPCEVPAAALDSGPSPASGRRAVSRVAALSGPEPIAHGAKARESSKPSVLGREADHAHIRAAAEAQPLHDLDFRTALIVLAGRPHLVAWLAADSHRFRTQDLHVLDAWRHRKRKPC